MRNKQAELQKKMMLAKQQAAQTSDGGDDEGPSLSGGGEKKIRMTDEELKEVNDRKRFEELLNSQSASINAYSADAKSSSENYLSQEQEEETIDAYRKFFYHMGDLNSLQYNKMNLIDSCLSLFVCFLHRVSFRIYQYNQVRGRLTDSLREIQHLTRHSKNWFL